MSNKKYWILAGSALLIGAPAAHAAETDAGGVFSVTAGANYSSGKYGTNTSTDIWSVPLTAAYQTDRWTFKLVVPYIYISGAGNVIPGIGSVNNGNPKGRGHGKSGPTTTTTATTTTTSGTASGLGDITASAGYELFSSADRSFGLDLTGNVNFGTASAAQGLGTGQTNYGLSLDSYKVSGNWTMFGGVGWMNYGSSQYIQLKNGFNANVGAGYKLSPKSDIGAYYYYRERIATGGAAQSELTAYWNYKLSNSLRLQTYVLGGFANGSPDYGVGASVKYSL